ncbi:MAG: putative gliding protein mglA [Promethearchaeota archaeon]|nr:MAG: putative gliding protein mglA [Candidatus Lokiarchaeota archaeon]
MSEDKTAKNSLSLNNMPIIQLKLVFWGPGKSGKTTSFHCLQKNFSNASLTGGYSVETTSGRTLWQDSIFLSFSASVKGYQYSIAIQVVTCTGQERFLSTREYVLEGADGVIFVADSDPSRTTQNKRSFRELISFMKSHQTPYIIQLNKRDLENKIGILEFKKELKLPVEETFPDGIKVVYPTIAIKCTGIVECFQDLLSKMIFQQFKEDL